MISCRYDCQKFITLNSMGEFGRNLSKITMTMWVRYKSKATMAAQQGKTRRLENKEEKITTKKQLHAKIKIRR